MDLSGKTILITRASSQSAELRDALSRLGAHVIDCPTIRIAPVEDWTSVDLAIQSLDSYQWLLFTSANAVEHFMTRVDAVRGGKLNTPIAVVGPATAKKLSAWNLTASLTPESYRAEGLLDALPVNLAGVRILFPRAATAREILPEELRRRGAMVDVLTVYRTVQEEALSNLMQLLSTSHIDCVVFTSPSTVRFMAEALGDQFPSVLKNVSIAVIGPVTREAVETLGLKVSIQPNRSTVQDLVAAIRERVGKA